MKSTVLKTTLGLFLAVSPALLAQGVGQDMKKAGHDVAQGTKEAGKAVGHTAEKTGKTVKHGTQKVVHKSANKTEEGAARVKQKTK
jgi:hypothetical protein